MFEGVWTLRTGGYEGSNGRGGMLEKKGKILFRRLQILWAETVEKKIGKQTLFRCFSDIIPPSPLEKKLLDCINEVITSRFFWGLRWLWCSRKNWQLIWVKYKTFFFFTEPASAWFTENVIFFFSKTLRWWQPFSQPISRNPDSCKSRSEPGRAWRVGLLVCGPRNAGPGPTKPGWPDKARRVRRSPAGPEKAQRRFRVLECTPNLSFS